ncbi:MAG: hypothetical protein Kow00105_01430 [Phycisphaeraceae bacterium]
MWTPVEAGDAVRVAIEEFERRHPEYNVLLGTSTVRDATTDPTRFLLGVAGGSPPDLIHFDRFAVVEWASRGTFTDLTPFLEADRARPDGIHASNYYRAPWEECVYEGKVYAVPITVDTRGMYYNRDALVRAGLVYRDDDPEVLAGRVRVGQARPPKTWEELCRKSVHARARISPDGVVTLVAEYSATPVNGGGSHNSPVDLLSAGVRAGDVVALISGQEVFRGRLARIIGAGSIQIDLSLEQPPGLRSIPERFTSGLCQVKVFDQDSYTVRLTRYDPETGLLRTAGFIPLFVNSGLFMFMCQNNAPLLSEDGRRCLMDDPAGVEALQFMVDCYDVLGGVQVAQAFTSGLASGPMDPFVVGKVSLRLDSDEYLKLISAYGREMSFGACGAPIPARLEAMGHSRAGWMGGWAYAIPSTAKHKQGAWELMRWLCSMEANQLMAEFEASLARAQGQSYFPYSHPDKRVMRWLSQTYIETRPDITEDMRSAHRQFMSLLPESRTRPISPVGQRLWGEHMRSMFLALNHVAEPREALAIGKRKIQEALDRFFNPPEGPRVPWRIMIFVYLALVAVVIIVFIWWARQRGGMLYRARREWFGGYVCASPWLIGFIVFGAGPILFSLLISFCRYDVLNPAVWIGTDNYVRLMGFHRDPDTGGMTANDPQFWRSLWNTLYMVVSVPLGIVVGLGLALLLNSRAKGIAFFRTVYYLPAIVPAVAAFLLWIYLFDPVQGLINRALRYVGVADPPYWLNDPSWAKPALILMGLWAAGGGMIIWLAGLKEIPESLYEAARIDGANRIQQFTRITLPLLTPYIFFNFLMGLIGVFQTFESAYIMTDGGPADATLFYAYKLFNESFRYLNMGVASAMAWVMFVVVLAITLVQMWLGGKWVHYER